MMWFNVKTTNQFKNKIDDYLKKHGLGIKRLRPIFLRIKPGNKVMFSSEVLSF